MISKRKIHWPSKSQIVSLLTVTAGLVVTINKEMVQAGQGGLPIPPVVTADVQIAAIIVPAFCRSVLSLLSGLPGQDPNTTAVPIENPVPPVGINPGPPIAILLVLALIWRLCLPVIAQQATIYRPLPDPLLTPGATLPVTVVDIAVKGYAGKVRNVPDSVKKAVYAEYGITTRKPGEYEVDHLISLELGGSNSIKNLWPQSYLSQPWNAHVKDLLENELHRRICLPSTSPGYVSLTTAQHEISTNWIEAYKKYFHTEVPLKGKSAPLTD